jgi:hypothetical protein
LASIWSLRRRDRNGDPLATPALRELELPSQVAVDSPPWLTRSEDHHRASTNYRTNRSTTSRHPETAELPQLDDPARRTDRRDQRRRRTTHHRQVDADAAQQGADALRLGMLGAQVDQRAPDRRGRGRMRRCGMSARINNGTGTFVSAPITITSATPADSRLAFDADGDGDDDLLAIASYPIAPYLGFAILRNQGALQFTASPVVPLAASNPGPIAVADFDGDADLDVLIGFFFGGGSIHRWTNDGTGTFAHDPAGVVGASGPDVASLAIADLDLDGDPDVHAGRYSSNATRHLVLRNSGGTLVADPSAVPAQDAAGFVGLGDVDGDGDPDAVVGFTSLAYYGLVLWINDGTGRFTFAENLDLQVTENVMLEDVDRDGDADLFGVTGSA